MKIAITSEGPVLESLVDARFGRCAYFIIYDIETGTFEARSNTQNLNSAQGAGIQSASLVCDAGSTVLITGHCGPKAFSALSAGGIEVYTTSKMPVAKAIQAFRANELKRLSGADVDGHW